MTGTALIKVVVLRLDKLEVSQAPGQGIAGRRASRAGVPPGRPWRRRSPPLASDAGEPDAHARRGFSYYAFSGWPVASLSPTFSPELAQEIAVAEAEIQRLNNDPPRTQLLEAVARQLLRAEAVASSRIEGLDLSHRKLAEAAFEPEGTTSNARSVYANVRAMEESIRLATRRRPFTVDDLRKIHARLFEGTRDEQYAGVIRQEQNWIGENAYSAYGADFSPGPDDDVPRLLGDLCLFVERDDLPAVGQAGIAHAQFETIHPFIGGNGRVGRCLIHLVLGRRGLAAHYVAPISVALAASSDAYVAGLTAYRDQKIDEWSTVFARAVTAAAGGAKELAARIETLKERWRGQADRPRLGSAACNLIEVLPAHPVIDLRTTEEILDVSDEAARQGIERLARAGVLREITGRRRGRVWECVGLFALLDQFDRLIATPPGAVKPGRRAPRPTR